MRRIVLVVVATLFYGFGTRSVALIMALDRAMRNRGSGVSIYEQYFSLLVF